MEEDSFVAKIVHRLIKKHIAGNTMSAAIKKTKQLNGKGIVVSITFLSDAPKDLSKSSYITATYSQLIREISRLGLKASLHIPLEQLGIKISKEATFANARKIVEFGNKYGVFVWFEAENNDDIIKELASQKGVGIALKDLGSALLFSSKNKPKTLKLILTNKLDEKGIDSIKKLADKTRLVVLSQNDPMIEKLIKMNSYKKSLIFEFQLGYSEKKLGKWVKKGVGVGVYLPFGRDWVSYAIKNMPAGYMRSIASSLLVEKEKRGKGGKNEEK